MNFGIIRLNSQKSNKLTNNNRGLTVNYYTDAMRRYFDFEGRASRTQYWIFNLILFGIMVVALALDIATDDQSAEPAAFFTGIVVLAHFIPALAITARRLHDTDKSAWWLLLMLAPGIGAIVLLIFMCTPTQTINNHYASPMHAAKSDKLDQAVPPSTNNPLNQLEKIASLRAAGAIDEDEFKQLKAGVLSRTNQ